MHRGFNSDNKFTFALTGTPELEQKSHCIKVIAVIDRQSHVHRDFNSDNKFTFAVTGAPELASSSRHTESMEVLPVSENSGRITDV